MFVGEAFVVDAKQVQQGGLKIMDVDGVLGGVHSKGVTGTIGDARLHAAAGHPSREGIGMMIAAPLLAVFHVALQKGRAAKFTAPNDERVIEQPALLEITQQSGARLVGVFALGVQFSGHAAVLVPPCVHHLHKARAAFNKPASHQAIIRECPALFHLRPIKIQHAFGFAGNIR